MRRAAAWVGLPLQALACSVCLAADMIELAAAPFEPRAAVPPLLVLAIDAGAKEALAPSWPGPYQVADDYEGYFHHGLCYRHGAGVFVPAGPADAQHYCDGQSWSGNFLNWASMSALDTLRYGLMGGKRVLDTERQTVLERADLGQQPAPEFVKSIGSGQADLARLTPFKPAQLHLLSCGTRLQLRDSLPAGGCRARQAGGLLADLDLRVEVCQDEDARPSLCRPYERGAKPEGALQAASAWLRIALQTGAGRFTGGGLIGARALGPAWTRIDNPQPQWDAKSGVLSGGDTVLNRLMNPQVSSALPANDDALMQWATAPQTGLHKAGCQVTHLLRWPDVSLGGGDGAQQLHGLRRRLAGLMRQSQLAAMPQRISLALARNRSLYLAQNEVSDLSSTLARSELPSPTEAGLSLPVQTLWQASVAAPDEREIFITGGQGSFLPLGAAGLTAAQLESLRRSPYGSRADGQLLARLDWLRGAQSVQAGQGTLAPRSSAFGSQLAGNLGLLDLPAAGKDAGLVFMSTGDGLLHAIDAADGHERFAWMPQALLRHLAAVSAPDFPALSLLDGGLSLAALQASGTSSVLVAVAGGHSVRGVFALEINTAAGALGTPLRALEFTAADDQRVGHVLHAPRLVRIARRQGNAVVLKPFLLFSAGINANAGLYLLALDKQPGLPWREGSDFFFFPVPTVAGEEASRHLSPPAVVLGEDQRLLHAWAGDGQGRMWRFSFEDNPRATAGFSARVALLFSARSAQGRPQAISAAPRIAYAQDQTYQVLFGTGRWLDAADAAPGAAAQETFYAVPDRLSGTGLGRSDLSMRALEAAADGWRVTSSPGAAPPGWLIDFPELGERVTESALLEGGRVLLTTRIAPSDPCQPLRQHSWDFDALQGSNENTTGRSVSRSLQAPLLLRYATEATDPAAQKKPARTMLFLDLPAPGQSVQGLPLPDPVPSGRLAWREIANWSRLHDAQSKP